MKYLELDARHPECHGLARALVGSLCALERVSEYLGIFTWAHSEANYPFGMINQNGALLQGEVVYIPLDTIKLCPFVAMREGVELVVVSACGDKATGYIRAIDTNTDYILVGNVCFDWVENSHELSPEITLDLDNLPKGARVVEVEK